jgi:hypothetical protein
MTEDVQLAESKSRPQFGLAALLWTMGVIGLALAYLRQLDSPTVFLGGAVAVGAAIVFGAAIGWPLKRPGDATYWAVVITTAAYISVAGETSYGPSFHFAWSLTGTLAGAFGGAIAPRRWLLRIVTGAGAGGAAMWLYVVMRHGGTTGMMFDVICAPVVGGLVGVLIELLLWVERESSLPRYITACWLLLAMIAGNLMVPLVLE